MVTVAGHPENGCCRVAGFENFLADLAQLEEQADHGASPGKPETGRVVVQILDEIVNASVLIAVTTAIANAAEKGERAVRTSELAVYTPALTPVFHGLVDKLLGGNADLSVCQSVQNYCARLSLAQRMSQAFGNERRDSGDVAIIDPELLSDTWRRACGAAIACIENLTPPSDATPKNRAGPNAHTLAILRMAARGASPCIEADGRITIPGWAERRREPRRSVQRAASLQIGQRMMPVMIRDVSTSGLGLDCPAEATPGERVVVRLPGNRMLPGEVAWADGKRIGIRLDQRLVESDQLLSD